MIYFFFLADTLFGENHSFYLYKNTCEASWILILPAISA